MKHKQGKPGSVASSSGSGDGKAGNGSKGAIDREGQIKLGILIRRMYEADLQKQAPENITDLVKRFDKTKPTAEKTEQSDEDSRS
jgi:carbon monoxide dehydrogenase subunit G